MTPPRTVSVIIPTHNRCASLNRAMLALSAQSYPREALEVVVVADGCTDDTSAVGSQPWPITARVIVQACQGPAASRNRGADAAAGDLLIFLDDDIEVSEGFVAAHARRHADAETVVIGYLPADIQGRRDFFSTMLRSWWAAMFDAMRAPGHRFCYRDLLSGNFSIARTLFLRVGGFDEALYCHEDYELGYRLVAAGARLSFAEDAVGWHHEHTDLRRALRRKRDEGRADLELARRHPALAGVLPFHRDDRPLTARGRWLRRLAVGHPTTGDLVEKLCRLALLPMLEAARFRGRWRRLLDELLLYWYWRGIGDCGGTAALRQLRGPQAAPAADLPDVELQHGLEHAARAMDVLRAPAVRLRWGPLIVGTVPVQPGAEPLQGRHLGALLRDRFQDRLADTLTLVQALASLAPDSTLETTAVTLEEQTMTRP